MNHITDRIQACLDGEATPAEAEAIRAHCGSCEACARAWAEAEALQQLLARDAADTAPQAPLWPAIRERLAAPARIWRPAFALGMGAALVVGLIAGLAIGPSSPSTQWDEAQTLAGGSLLAAGTGMMFDDIYLADAIADEEER